MAVKKRVVVWGDVNNPPKVELSTAKAAILAGADAEVTLDIKKIDTCDALILPGGLADISPVWYGEENQGSSGVDLEFDRNEMEAIARAMDKKIPIFGICRGCQLLNVYFGGSLIQDISEKENHMPSAISATEEAKYLMDHDSYVASTSPMYSTYGAKCKINSAHHQAIKHLADDLLAVQMWFSDKVSEVERMKIMESLETGNRIEADNDHIIEAFVHKTLPVWGVQWHPELLAVYPVKDVVNGQKIFNEFLALIKG